MEVNLNTKKVNILDFVAIDFETANAKRTSACSIGIVTVKENEIVDTRNYLIKPYPYCFDPINVSIHGITESDVESAPKFDVLWDEISNLIKNKIVVAHNAAFDISVLSRTLAHYDIPFPECDSLCTYQLSRNAFPELGCYRLDFVSEILDVDLTDHHNAECDAVACAEILLKYIDRYDIISPSDFKLNFGVGLQHLTDKSFDCNGFKKAYQHWDQTRAKQFVDVSAEYLDDDFVNKNFVFTGTLTAFTRNKAMEIVKKGGGFPQDNVTKSTNFLVVGKQDLSVVKDGFSGKMKKAIEYRKKGLNIEIIDENRFVEMIDSDLLNLCTSCTNN